MKYLAQWLVILASVGWVVSPASAGNLIANSGFEQGFGRSGSAADWDVQTGNGFTAERTADQPHSGKFAMQLQVAQDAPVNWDEVSQELPAPRSQQQLTLSAYVRTVGVKDGNGAYLSINFFDSQGKRTAYFDSPALTGDHAYTRLTVTGAPAPGSSTMRAILLIYGHGAAVFDDVQLEAGDQVTAYAPSPEDAERERELAARQVQADAFFQAAGYQRSVGHNIAIMSDALPTKDASTPPADIAAVMKAHGYVPLLLTAAQLANPFILSPSRFDVLILPDGDAFPAQARQSLVDYLAGGGCYFSMGGYTFDDPLVKIGAAWFRPDAIPAARPTFSVPAVSFTVPQAVKPEDAGGHALDVGVVTAAGNSGYALRLFTPALNLWGTYRLPVDVARLPKGWSQTRLRARADRDDTHLIVEWTEKDGSRWQKVLTLSTRWQNYVIPAGNLSYWQDNPSVGRGGPGDQFHPENAASMLFGFSIGTEKNGSRLGVDIAWIKVEDDANAALRQPAPWINTRYGHIRDAMYPDPDQIGAFDPSHPLHDAASARAAGGQYVIPAGLSIHQALDGYVATCMLGVSGHGFDPNRCRLIPLINTYSPTGQFRGAAMSIAYQYSGFYKGSAWGFCGISNHDLFGTGKPLNPILPDVIHALVRRVFLNEGDADYACYRPGETANLHCSVSDFGPAPFTGEVRLQIQGKQAGAQPVEIKPGGAQAYQWRVPITAGSNFINYQFELVQSGKVVDVLPNGVVVWRDADVRKGPTVGIHNSMLTFNGRPQFIVGSQLWWGQVQSVTARSPLQFKRDFEQMKSFGFHISRSFLAMDTKQQRRISDAIVALGAANGIVVFHTPNLSPTAPLADLARWPSVAREIAQRYKGVPNIIIDLCNEPTISANEPGLLQPWNDFLRKRYGTIETLRAAWGPDAPKEDVGAIPVPKPADDWASAVTADLDEFLVQHHREWARQLEDAIHAIDPTRLVSVGYLPDHGWAGNLVAPQVASLDLDFTDRHFYGVLTNFPSENAWIDERLIGKPSSIGEFGARNHPGFGSLYEDTATYNHRFEYIVTHAFGMGDSFADSWHWRDPMEGIFPFGQVHADNVPRPVAYLMQKMAQTFGGLDRSGKLPSLAVMLPTHNLLGGDRPDVITGVTHCFDTLLGLHVPFAVIADRRLGNLPASVNKLICPIPYVLSNAEFDQLLAFVKRGGSVVITGDFRYDLDRRLSTQKRLEELAGVRAGNPSAPLDVLHGASQQIAASAGFPGFSCHPAASFTADGATQLNPVTFENKVAAGRVLFIGAPLEVENGDNFPLRDIYARCVSWLGAERVAVQPDSPDIHVFPIDLIDNSRKYVIWNEGPALSLVIHDGGVTKSGQVGARTWALF